MKVWVIASDEMSDPLAPWAANDTMVTSSADAWGTSRLIIDFDRDGWFVNRKPTLRLVLEHMRRIQSADLGFPVILDADGTLMDGAHRIAKCLSEGNGRISAVRFPATPQPSWIESL